MDNGTSLSLSSEDSEIFTFGMVFFDELELMLSGWAAEQGWCLVKFEKKWWARKKDLNWKTKQKRNHQVGILDAGI